MLLYPSILLAMLVWRGWRYLLRPQVWPAQAVCLAAMALRYAIEILGQPGYFETIQAQRPYVGLILDLPAAWAAYAPLLIAPERLPWTLFGLLAVAVAAAAWGKARWRMAQVVSLSPGDTLLRPAVPLYARLYPVLCRRPVARNPLPVSRAACVAVGGCCRCRMGH